MRTQRSRPIVPLIVSLAMAAACEQPVVPQAPELDAAPPLTNQSSLLLGGLAEPQADIQVRGGSDSVATARAGEDGRFEVSVALRPDMENTLLVSQLVAGSESPAATVRVVHDGTPPAIPSLDGVVSPTRRTSQTIRGTSESDAEIRISGGSANAVGRTDASGNFAIDVALSTSASGTVENQISVIAVDAAGNESPAAQASITFDPDLPLDAPLFDEPPGYVSDSSVMLSGSAEPGVRISVVGGATDAQATADSEGRFALAVNLRPNQANNLIAFAIAGANASASVNLRIVHDDIAPDVPEIDPQASPTGAEMIRLTGLSEAGASILISGGASAAMGSAEEDGAFALPVALNLDSENALSIVAADLAGNMSEAANLTIVQDSTLEAPIVVDPVASPTASPTVMLSGTAAANVSVEITGGAATVGAMSDDSGAWSADVGLRANVRNELRVTRPGSGVDTVVTIDHDDLAPDAPMLNELPSPTGSTTVRVSGSTEPRARVSVTGGMAPVAQITGVDGRFALDVVIAEDAETALSAIATDRAGNASDPRVVSVTHSSSIPDAPSLDETNPAPTSMAMHTVSGTVANPGAGVSVMVRGGAADASGPTDPSTGTFAVAVSLNANASNALSVVSVEGTIESAAAAVTILHDDIAPTAPVASSISAISSTCIGGVPTGGTVSGSMNAVEARSRVRIENVTGARMVSATATDGGSFNASLGTCAGDVIRIIAIDAAGNESSPTEITAG